MPTIEEASRCPKCDQQGKEHSSHPSSKGSKVIVFHCQNDLCPWLATGWAVQVKADGTIPEYKRGPKQFEALTVYDKLGAQRVLDELKGENE